MKWRLTEKPWFRTVSLWAWWEIVSGTLLATALIAMLIMGYMMHGVIFAGAIVIATGMVIWHLGWLKKSARECALIILIGCVLGPLAVGAGYGIGVHKADDLAAWVTYDFSVKKERRREPDEKKPKKEKEPKPGSPEYFDAEFARLNEKIDQAGKDAKEARSLANGAAKSAKAAKDGVEKITHHLKINFQSEEEPLDFPVIVKPGKEVELLPPLPEPENGTESGLKLQIAPQEPPPSPDEEDPQPIKRKSPESKEPGKFQRSTPPSPGKEAKPPRIASDDPNDPIVASLCTNGVEHPIAQFCKNESGGIRFVDEAKDRCRNDPTGKPCTCARWLRKSEIAQH